MSWQRSEPVTCTVTVDGRAYPHLGTDLNYKVVDEQGRRLPHQIIAGAATVNELKLLFYAENVPSIGYKTFYLVPKESSVGDGPAMNKPENSFYNIKLAQGGITSIYDKELQKELLDTRTFLGGELFTMNSVGEGAGEWTLVQQPTMEGFEKLSSYKPHWNLIEAGPVRTVWELAQRLEHVTVRQRVALYHQTKRIDFETDLLGWEGVPYREFRLAFPLNMQHRQIAYEVPMGVVEVGTSEIKGAAGKSASYIDYTQTCAEVHPREVQDWFHANNGDWGVTMSSSVAVFDWIDPTANPVNYPVLQPILLASRRSCNQKGNWYLQAGDHSFRFSLTSHKSDWRGNFYSSVGAVQPMPVVVEPPRHKKANLTETFSFFSIDQKNALISTIKKCDDSDDVVFRLYDIEGRDMNVNIHSFKTIEKMQPTTMIEETVPEKSIEKSIKLGAYSIETIKVKMN
jgi:alpha-mannosidase